MISLSVKLYFDVILLLNVHDILARLQDDYWSEDFDHSKNCENEGRRQKCVTMSNFSSVQFSSWPWNCYLFGNICI